MIRLIKNELFKIFHKKSTIVTLAIFFILLTLITGIASKIDFNSLLEVEYEFTEDNLKYYKDEMRQYDVNNEYQISSYVEAKNQVDYIEFVRKYDSDTWQYRTAKDKALDLFRGINTEKYINKDEDRLAELEAELDEFKNKLDNNEWREFESENKILYETEISTLKQELALTNDTTSKEKLKQELQFKELRLEITNYRLDNNVPYGKDFLNKAIDEYENNSIILLETNTDNLNDEEKEELENTKKSIAESKYIMENKVDVNSSTNARAFLLNSVSGNLMLFVVFMALIAGSIMSDEYNKGTIKNLLIKPYTRLQVFIAKYISCLIMLAFVVVAVCLYQFIIGGLFTGFSSYKIPIIVYNYETRQIVEISMIRNLFDQFLAILPILMLLFTLALSLGTIFSHTAVSIVLCLLGYVFSDVINMIIQSSKIGWLKYFPTMVWDLQGFMYGATPSYTDLSLNTCIITSSIYLVIMLVVTTFVFKHKNIKNI